MKRFFRLSFVSGLPLTAFLPMLAFGQQYMKSPNVTNDAQFDGWIKNGQLVKCRAIAQAAYPDGPKEIMDTAPKPSGVCYWDVDRAAEVAPSALVVHAGTRILVRIKRPRPNEVLLPSVVYAKIVPPSPGNDILKNAINPLQAITPSPAVNLAQAHYDAGACITTVASYDAGDADACQGYLINQVNSIQASINHANAALACLESYQIATPSNPHEKTDPPPQINAYTCASIAMINPEQTDSGKTDSFAFQKTLVMGAISTAVNIAPPLAQFTQLDNFITKPNSIDFSSEISKDGEIKNAIGAIQTAQATLQQSYVVLMAVPDTATSVFYYFDIPHLTTATATITGTEVVSKTASTLATWTASSTSYNVVFSAGLGFSNLVYRTYANTPEVQNGAPVLNPSGNALSVVTETDTHLSVMAPEVLGSYVIPGLRRFDVSCSFGCSLLLSGGIGANLTSKTADFDTGLSLRFMDFLLTPAVHFGRESRLKDGITVGSQLGANAPSTLPTQNKWVRKFGIVLTYVIPLS